MVIDDFLVMADIAIDLTDTHEVAAQWSEASALRGYDVGSLAAHLARAVLTTDRYLADADITTRPAHAQDVDTAPTVGPAVYFLEALGEHDPVDSDVHRAIRARSQTSAADGQQAVIAELRAAKGRLVEALEPGRVDPLRLRRKVHVLGGTAMELGDYLITRLVELVLHADDLAVSIGVPTPLMPASAVDTVAQTLASLAVLRAGGLETVRSLARRERHPDAVRAL